MLLDLDPSVRFLDADSNDYLVTGVHTIAPSKLTGSQILRLNEVLAADGVHGVQVDGHDDEGILVVTIDQDDEVLPIYEVLAVLPSGRVAVYDGNHPHYCDTFAQLIAHRVYGWTV